MAYCSDEDVYSVITSEGVELATDDTFAGIENSDETTNAIDRADTTIDWHVSFRYDTTLLTRSIRAVKWASATIAAVMLFRRRGTVPPGLQQSYDELMEMLKAVRAGSMMIPGLPLKNEPGMTMSNLRLDQRYRVAKVRAQVAISTGEQASTKPRRTDWYYEWANFDR